MFFEFPNDANVLKMEDQYMVGGAVMVKPVVKPAAEGGESIEVYLPGAEV